MHPTLRVLLVASTLAVAFPRLAGSYELQTRYAELEAKRATIERQARDYERALAEASARRSALEQSFASCSSDVWPVYWQTRFEQAESKRSQVESERQRLEAARAAIETQRIRLEEKRRMLEADFAGRPRGAAYEERIGSYMNEFEALYISPMQELVFPSYRAYHAAITVHSDLIERATQACANPDLTVATIEATDHGISEMTRLATELARLVGL